MLLLVFFIIKEISNVGIRCVWSFGACKRIIVRRRAGSVCRNELKDADVEKRSSRLKYGAYCYALLRRLGKKSRSYRPVPTSVSTYHMLALTSGAGLGSCVTRDMLRN